ncbi:E3 ubiquitin-protein ligase TRIM71-like [Ruditapes philippinarum]|uniref:E3 ubiquitin-protein ligase TRIM71-like n=1 Tax=Ruditapes philippinarum TaxID=129788 RepID=UPI00295C2FEA|nr:E3 ubiquitin-protein ligase TRIM71-like [Ruditapes philippinarum]
MEVSGKKKSKCSNKSPTDFVFRCHPCDREGEKKEAKGFCQTCTEYLCVDCYKCHCKPTPTKNHILLDKDSMPRDTKFVSAKHNCTEVCLEHGSQLVHFFCREHDAVGCTTCMTLCHNSCDIDFIPDISADFKESMEYYELVNKVKRLKNDVHLAKKKVEEDVKAVEDLHMKAVDDIRSFRNEINTYLDNIVKKLLVKCENLKQRNETFLRTTLRDMRDMKRNLKDMYVQITKQTRALGDLFVHAKQNSNVLQDIEQKITESVTNDLQMFTFERNSQVRFTFEEKERSFGELKAVDARTKKAIRKKTFPDHFTPECVKTVSVKSIKDNKCCRITGIVVIATDTVICCDFNNNLLKLKNIKADKVTSVLKLSADPCDVTCLSCYRLAVTTGDKKNIFMVSYANGCLSKQTSFAVSGECAGITAFEKEKLAVSFIDPPKVEILSTDGKVLERFSKDRYGKELFLCPRYIATDWENECFYISDTLKHTVVKMSKFGQVLSEYRDDNLVNPKGIEVCGDGTVIVCNFGNGNLHMISPNCEKKRILLHGIKKPRVVCVKIENERPILYLSSESGNEDVLLKYKFD